MKILKDKEALEIHRALHSGEEFVLIGGTRWPVTKGKDSVRMVRVVGITFATQNKTKMTKYAELARRGKRVTWAMTEPTWGLIMSNEEGEDFIAKHCIAFPGLEEHEEEKEEKKPTSTQEKEKEKEKGENLQPPSAKKEKLEPSPTVQIPYPSPVYVFADNSKPPCRYASNCFRRAPGHFLEFSHPKEVIERVMSRLSHPQPPLNSIPQHQHHQQSQNGADDEEATQQELSEKPTVDLIAGTWKVSASQLVLGEKIGAGAFGEVRKAKWQGKAVAVKILHDQTANAQKMFVQEAELMCRVHHPNIIECFAACTDPPNLCVIMEFASGGALSSLIAKNHGPMNPRHTLEIALGIVNGIAYLHACKPPILHRDLKPENILLDETHLIPKIADFGVSREKAASEANMTRIGTPIFCAPEVISGKGKYNEKCDCYSFGLILWSMCTGKRPYEGMGEDGVELTPFQVMMRVVQDKLRPAILDSTHPGISQLIKESWDQSPDKRPSAEQILDIIASLMEQIH